MSIKKRITKIALAVSLGLCHPLAMANSGLDALLEANKSAKQSQTQPEKMPEGEGKELIKNAFSMLNDIVWSQALPVKGMVMMVSRDGTQVLASTDGRILVKGGEVFDGWNRSPIATEANAKAAWLAKIDKVLGVSVKDMAAYYIGDLAKTEPDLVVFVDPLSKLNADLFNKLLSIKGKQIALLLTPIVNGKEAAIRARELWCAKDQSESLRLLVNSGFTTAPETLENCDIKKLSTTIGVTQFLQIRRLPYFVNGHGLHNVGLPDSLTDFISQTEK
ncbi:hypothetical protein ACRN98_19460 [Shewanella oncorhynchi]|uniref:hypothetical protein n=1 Tax=Shewanella TaxID=22 RepID=UPI0021D9DA3A|nr:hypothetical protein [Shewanella sp. SM69]MCU8040722.1 hypothetical protein [Shewanella sp. SM69]